MAAEKAHEEYAINVSKIEALDRQDPRTVSVAVVLVLLAILKWDFRHWFVEFLVG